MAEDVGDESRQAFYRPHGVFGVLDLLEAPINTKFMECCTKRVPDLHCCSIVDEFPRISMALRTPVDPTGTPSRSYDERLSRPWASICAYARRPTSLSTGLHIGSPSPAASLMVSGTSPRYDEIHAAKAEEVCGSMPQRLDVGRSGSRRSSVAPVSAAMWTAWSRQGNVIAFTRKLMPKGARRAAVLIAFKKARKRPLPECLVGRSDAVHA